MKKAFLFFLICFTMLSWSTKKQSIFLIGDSISIEYWKHLKEYISGFATLDRKRDDGEALKNLDVPLGANGGDSKMVLLYLESKVKEPGFKPDYMLINCGLHDIKRNPQSQKIQIEEHEYCGNIRKIFELLKKNNIKPIWINTTWVVDKNHNSKSKAFYRYNADVIKYNEIASNVCKEFDIPIIDLYTFSKNLGEEQIRDHVHYTPNAQTLQASYIAGFVQKYLKGPHSSGQLHTRTINIVDKGAKGDGVSDNTDIIQQAIDECTDTGGTVIIPSGIYMTSALRMKSNVNLHLEQGAILRGSTDFASYRGMQAIIYAKDMENISITGCGTIDGQGNHPNFQYGDNKPMRAKIILFTGCKNIRVEGVNLINPGEWTQSYRRCDGIQIRGIRVVAHGNYNNDGLDIDSKNVIISDCYIDADDDAICFKSENNELCENITVTNCILRSNCNAIKFGTASFSGFRNIVVSNCIIQKATEDHRRQWYKTEPWMGTTDKTVIAGIALESVDGGVMEQILISNIIMTDVQTPIFIRLGDRSRKITDHISILKDININNIIARNASLIACSVTGVPGGIAENICIKDVQITSIGNKDQIPADKPVPENVDGYPENRMFRHILPASGFYVRHVRNIRFENVRLNTLEVDTRPMFYLEDSENVDIVACKKDNKAAKIVKK